MWLTDPHLHSTWNVLKKQAKNNVTSALYFVFVSPYKYIQHIAVTICLGSSGWIQESMSYVHQASSTVHSEQLMVRTIASRWNLQIL
jgi:hypothetical protein